MLSPSLSSAVHTRLAAAFGIDLRTLALFRVVLGAVLLHDSLRRFADLRAFYSDDGLMPRAWLTALEGPLRFSLHAASGGMAWPALLLAIASLAAFCLMIGHRARLAAGISWLLLASLNTRNPLVLIGGDYLMVCLLFWTMFLPVSARYSADAVLARNTPPASNTHVSWPRRR